MWGPRTKTPSPACEEAAEQRDGAWGSEQALKRAFQQKEKIVIKNTGEKSSLQTRISKTGKILRPPK